jgi:hypothetical protein
MLSSSATTFFPARFFGTAWEIAAVLVLLGELSTRWILCRSRCLISCRFETRDECEEIIRKYHGIAIGHDGQLMQVRYADTPAQKELKRITAERRQFRTNEYNIGAYGTADVGVTPSIYNQWGRRSGMGNSGYVP